MYGLCSFESCDSEGDQYRAIADDRNGDLAITRVVICCADHGAALDRSHDIVHSGTR